MNDSRSVTLIVPTSNSEATTGTCLELAKTPAGF